MMPLNSRMVNETDPLRVFISSTFLDLQAYRQAVFDCILGMGYTTQDMIYWSADERQPATLSVDRVRESDVLILLVAHRYGHVPEGAMLSITEQEYNAANSFRVPVLAFVLDETFPWPPGQIDWEKRDQLGAFKNRIRAEVTARFFTTPDQLSALVSQALASFRRRNVAVSFARRSGRPSFRVAPSAHLHTAPDLHVEIGGAEDDLPLVLSIRRSHNLSSLFEQLGTAIERPGLPPPRALLSSFRQSFEQHATRAWASDDIEAVRMSDDSVQSLFVPKTPLLHFFESTFAALLTCGRGAQKARSATAISAFDRSITRNSLPSFLQSEGGSNRFLGVATKDGSVYSVGKTRDPFGQVGSEWVMWRPFIYESLPTHFPNATFVVRCAGDSKHVAVSQYAHTIHEALLSSPQHIDLSVNIEIPQTAVASLLIKVAEAVATLHEKGKVHGDLKPNNILLSSKGIELIDDFELAAGQVAPGWTPDWSAPEQVIGAPVSYGSDVYAFGRMICDLLGARLSGEVRKFKVSMPNGETREFDVFYDPSLRCTPERVTALGHGLPEWIELVRRCLRFDPLKRPSSIRELGAELRGLSEKYPLTGTSELPIDKPLILAAFTDGREGPARQIVANMRTDDPPDKFSGALETQRPVF